MPLVSITRLRVRSWRFMPMFFVTAMRSARQAARADGNLETKLLRDANRTFWTATSWADERAMKAFMHAGAHGPAMRKLLEWCDEASLVHWTQETDAVPPWDEAHARLQREGRRSKVHHPSPAHDAFSISAPVKAATVTLRARTLPPSSST
ncbi:MAG TPA: DUF3291 domain-containing protein [Vicinamibacterales bacterium]|nr:DUF3291 domain-containing protein [Vicinamibacterales bacterium]